MPANRPHVDHDAKAAEVLDAAELMLLGNGYESTTMAAIARAAGVATNSVYWYFPSKDELLAAVLRRRQEQAFARLGADADAPLREQAIAVLAELDSVATLTATVHERAKHSPAVAEVHEAFHAELGSRLRHAFKAASLSDHDAQMASDALIAIVEGVHLHSPTRDPSARNELVLWALQRFSAPQSD